MRYSKNNFNHQDNIIEINNNDVKNNENIRFEFFYQL